ncbi:class I SAM-dependent methyltransferase [Pollutibacter soli]|uniref:class I SAM-dependent methyltransferase n=1 Tax=Pollutibacter soli TaxID=3034157 RepID=UPI003013989C
MPKKEFPYNDKYASVYDSIWITNDFIGGEVQHNVNKVGEILTKDMKWLDCGCGTGYLLSKFPGYQRAGFDLTPAMLNQAGQVNKDLLFLRQKNILEDEPEWHNQWDLITCTGQPWSYLDTIHDIEKVAGHLAAYTKKGGTCMIAIIDIADYIKAPNYHSFHYYHDIPVNVPVITSIIWDLKEEDAYHQAIIFPSADQWIRWMGKYFKKIEVSYYALPSPPIYVPRKVLICTEKREPGDDTPVEVHNPPFVLTDDKKIRYLTKSEIEKRFTFPGINPRVIDLPLSYFLERMKPWQVSFWKRIVKKLIGK